MDAEQRREVLRQLMDEYGVSISDVAEILEKSYDTVKNWRANNVNLSIAPPKNELRLLKFELEARKAGNEKTLAAANN